MVNQDLNVCVDISHDMYNNIEADGKRPSAALPSSLVTAAYFYVRFIPRDFRSLAPGHFPSASEVMAFSTVSMEG